MIIFLLLSALILGSALAVVMVKNLIHSALWLIASFFGVGALYLRSTLIDLDRPPEPNPTATFSLSSR